MRKSKVSENKIIHSPKTLARTFIRRSSLALCFSLFSQYLCFLLFFLQHLGQLCSIGSDHVLTRPGPDSSQSDRRTNRKRKEHYLSVCCSVLRAVCLRVIKLSAVYVGDSFCFTLSGQTGSAWHLIGLSTPPIQSPYLNKNASNVQLRRVLALHILLRMLSLQLKILFSIMNRLNTLLISYLVY